MDRKAAFAFIEEIAADLSGGNVVFPTSFDTTVRLRELLRSERSSMADLAAIVMLDPLLASKILQAANSAALNPSGGKILDVRTAVIRLGVGNVRSMAIAVAVQQLMTYKEMRRYQKLCDGFMRHSRYVAALAFVLAREHTKLPPDTAMFAGLVHDIGLFYLLYRIAGRDDLRLSEPAVKEILADWHGSIGHAVLSALGVPEEIQHAVDGHDELRSVESIRDLRALIFVANRISQMDRARRASLDGADGEPGAAEIRDFAIYVQTVEAAAAEIAAIMNIL